MMKRMWKNEKGFTLMEIVIVIVILGILALLAIPRLLGFTEQAELASDKEYAAVVARAAELHWATLPAATRRTTTSIAIGDIDDSGTGAALVEEPANILQYYVNSGMSVNIAILSGGVAQVTIDDSVRSPLVYDTVGGYTTQP